MPFTFPKKEFNGKIAAIIYPLKSTKCYNTIKALFTSRSNPAKSSMLIKFEHISILVAILKNKKKRNSDCVLFYVIGS